MSDSDEGSKDKGKRKQAGKGKGKGKGKPAGKGAKSAGSSEDGPREDELDAMGRKVWDKDYFTQKAIDNITLGPQKIGRRKDPVIPLPSSQRTYLKQRTTDLQLDQNLGKSRVVTNHTIKPLQGGYWCSVCECLIKDSSAYLEHVNGRRHNRNLGMNMKVEKIGVDRVRDKLKSMRKGPDLAEEQDIEAKLQALEEAEEERKRRKKEKKKNKKKRPGEAGAQGEEESGDEDPLQKRQRTEEAEEEEDENEEAEDEEMKLLKQMGLPTGFG